MADPNLPEEQPLPRQRKKLPPLRGAEENAEAEAVGEGANAAAKPRRKKKPPVPAPDESAPEPRTEAPDEQLLPASEQPQRPRKKKVRRRRPQQDEPQAEDAQAEDARRSPDGQEAAAAPQSDSGTRTRHIDVEGMPLASVLETVRDDVVTKDEGRDNRGADFSDEKLDEMDEPSNLGGQAGGDSNISDTIFRQAHNTRTFRAEKIEKYQQRVDQERKEREQYLQGVVEEDMSNSTLKCAIGFTNVFNYIGTILIGILPGFCVMHTLYGWLISSTFVDSYWALSPSMTIIFYVVLTVIIISVLERYDIGRMDAKSCLECVSFRHAGMVIILYFPAYLLSNAMYPTSLMVGWKANSTTIEGMAQGWRIMDTVRTALLVLGWLVIAFNTQFNKLVVNLQSELDDLIGEDDVELGASRS